VNFSHRWTITFAYNGAICIRNALPAVFSDAMGVQGERRWA